MPKRPVYVDCERFDSARRLLESEIYLADPAKDMIAAAAALMLPVCNNYELLRLVLGKLAMGNSSATQQEDALTSESAPLLAAAGAAASVSSIQFEHRAQSQPIIIDDQRPKSPYILPCSPSVPGAASPDNREVISRYHRAPQSPADVEPPIVFEPGEGIYVSTTPRSRAMGVPVDSESRKSSGVRGVSYNKQANAWRAQWVIDGKFKVVSFPVSKLGEDGALRLAIEKRREMESFGCTKRKVREGVPQSVSLEETENGWECKWLSGTDWMTQQFNTNEYATIDDARRAADELREDLMKRSATRRQTTLQGTGNEEPNQELIIHLPPPDVVIKERPKRKRAPSTIELVNHVVIDGSYE
jgi:hypothetical protein